MPRSISKARHDLLLRCVWLYHDDRLTQEQIAARFRISRSTVSRALSEAERLGIVRVVITEPLPEALRLETALTERYGITTVVGVPGSDESSRSTAGRAAARTFENLIFQDDITLAMGWGRTLAAMLPFLVPHSTKNVSIIGALGHDLSSNSERPVRVAQEVGNLFGADVEWVPAPLYSAGLEVTEALVSNSSVSRVLERARTADVLFLGIGGASLSNPLVSKDMLTPEAMTEMLDKGAVGDIVANFFDAEGNEVTVGTIRPVGLRLSQIREAKRVVAVAAGVDRVSAIRGAIAGGYVSELVTDQATAEALLLDG